MEIRISKPYDQDLIKETITKWNFAARRNFKTLGIYFFASIIYFLIGFSESVRHKSTIWNFGTSVGLACALLFLLSLYTLYRGRHKWISNTKYCIEKYANQLPAEYVFNDTLITVREPESYAEVKWPAFSSYKFHKGYLFLFFRRTDSSIVSLKKTMLSESDYSQLFSLIVSKLPERA